MNWPLTLQVLGILILAAGLALLAPWAGVVALGALLTMLGVAMEMGGSRGGRDGTG